MGWIQWAVGWGGVGGCNNNHKDYVGYLSVHETLNILDNYICRPTQAYTETKKLSATYNEVNLKPILPVWCLHRTHCLSYDFTRSANFALEKRTN